MIAIISTLYLLIQIMKMNQFLSKALAATAISIVIHSASIPVALSASVTTIAGAMPSEVQNVPTCYVKLENGEVRDLTKFCGFIKPQSCSGSLGSASRDRVLTEFCKQNEKCLLTNTCNIQPIAPYGPRPGEAAG
jgi:hypothetical protein